MKKQLNKIYVLEDHTGCYGNFNVKDSICRKCCALSISCAIIRDHNTNVELFEELFSSEGNSATTQ
ncbi:MAG: hypothetical protein GY714_19465 [Desulfobacterales bacterium]|nr:hypothetical protein [Desulfobacterales bacterium]MCP4164036.1 hypothetical protein [Deltaproteobacteria bacterium]